MTSSKVWQKSLLTWFFYNMIFFFHEVAFFDFFLKNATRLNQEKDGKVY